MMSPAGTPVVFVHGLWLHADSWGAWVDLFREAGYAPTAPGWPGDSSTIEETRNQPERVAGHGIDDVVEHYARSSASSMPSRSSSAIPSAALSSSGCSGMISPLQPWRSTLHRSRASSPCHGAASRIGRAAEPGQQEARGRVDRRAVPLRLRQCALRRGVRRALRTLDDPVAGEALVRGRLRQSLATLTGQGQHRQRDARAAARHRRRQGSHRPARHLEVDPQAVPQVTRGDRLQRVPRQRPLARARQRLAREAAGPLPRPTPGAGGGGRTGQPPSPCRLPGRAWRERASTV